MLVRAMRRTNAEDNLRLQMVLGAFVVGCIPIGSVFPYTFGMNLAPWPIILITIVPIILAYATVRQKLFSIQTIASELSIIALWIVLFVRVAGLARWCGPVAQPAGSRSWARHRAGGTAGPGGWRDHRAGEPAVWLGVRGHRHL